MSSMACSCKRIMDGNEHIHISTLEEEDNPVIPKDPMNKKEIEHMTPENKQLVPETDNSGLIDCTVQWVSNKNLQHKIVDRISVVVKKEEGEEEVEDHEVTKEPVVPPATKVSVETQTEFQKSLKNLEALTKERNQRLRKAFNREREQKRRRRRKTSMLMTLLLKRNLQLSRYFRQ